jgi:hypothetical protein
LLTIAAFATIVTANPGITAPTAAYTYEQKQSRQQAAATYQ